MPHFKDSLNRLYFLSDEDIANGGEALLPIGCVQITDEQADALRSADESPSGEGQARRFSSLEFLDLFTEPEQLAIVEASMQSAQIKLWYDRTLAASFITITDARVSAGLDALVDASLLTSARKAEIVAAMSA